MMCRPCCCAQQCTWWWGSQDMLLSVKGVVRLRLHTLALECCGTPVAEHAGCSVSRKHHAPRRLPCSSRHSEGQAHRAQPANACSLPLHPTWLLHRSPFWTPHTTRCRTSGDVLRNLGSSALDRATKLGYGGVLLGTIPLLVRPFHSLLLPWVSSCDPPGGQGKERGTPTALQQQLITTGLLGGPPLP